MPDRSLYSRVHAIREGFRPASDPELPQWTAEQWVAAVMIQLGDAAKSLHDGIADSGDVPNVPLGVEHLLACAAICCDAAEALTR